MSFGGEDESEFGVPDEEGDPVGETSSEDFTKRTEEFVMGGWFVLSQGTTTDPRSGLSPW